MLVNVAGDREGGRGGYGEGRFGDKKMGPGGDFNPEFQRVRRRSAKPCVNEMDSSKCQRCKPFPTKPRVCKNIEGLVTDLSIRRRYTLQDYSQESVVSKVGSIASRSENFAQVFLGSNSSRTDGSIG